MKNGCRTIRWKITESIIDEIVECVAVAIVGEFVAGRGQFLEALRCYGAEVAGEAGVVGEDHSAARHEAVNQRLLTHDRKRIRISISVVRFRKEASVSGIVRCREGIEEWFYLSLQCERKREREGKTKKVVKLGRRSVNFDSDSQFV